MRPGDPIIGPDCRVHRVLLVFAAADPTPRATPDQPTLW